MQIVAVTDPLTLGFRRQAMIAIKTDGDLEKVAGQLADMEEIDYVVIYRLPRSTCSPRSSARTTITCSRSWAGSAPCRS